MFSTAFDVLSTEAKSLGAYLTATHSIRGILSRVQPSLESTHLESDLLEVGVAAPDATRWRVMEHSLVVGRLYAIYENFCETLLSDWIDFLTKNLHFERLPQKIIDSYAHGFASIVAMLPSPRYPLLTTRDLVASYHSALQGQDKYSLTPECLIYHKNNLRWSELSELFMRCGVGDVGEWISRSGILSAQFFAGDDRVTDHVSARLSDFIQYRNDSSHGAISPDEILGYEELNDLVEFITALAEALDQFMKWKMVEILSQEGKAHAVGRITKVFPKADAFICLTKSVHVKVDQAVYVKKGSEFRRDMIASIQLDGDGVDAIDAEEGTELGMRLSRMPPKGSELFAVDE